MAGKCRFHKALARQGEACRRVLRGAVLGQAWVRMSPGRPACTAIAGHCRHGAAGAWQVRSLERVWQPEALPPLASQRRRAPRSSRGAWA